MICNYVTTNNNTRNYIKQNEDFYKNIHYQHNDYKDNCNRTHNVVLILKEASFTNWLAYSNY